MRTLLAAIVLCTSSVIAAAQFADIKSAGDEWAEAYAKGDVDKLVSMYAPDGVVVSAGTGRRFERHDGIREFFKLGIEGTKTRKVIIKDRMFREYGEIAIQNDTWDIHIVSNDDTAFEGSGRASVVYIKKPDGWYIVDHHPALNPPPRN